MSRLTWILLFVTLLLVACGPTVAEEPAPEPEQPTAADMVEPVDNGEEEQGEQTEQAATGQAGAAGSEAAQQAPESEEPAESSNKTALEAVLNSDTPHALSQSELEALNIGRHEWTNGYVGVADNGRTYTFVTSLEDYHINAIDAQKFIDTFAEKLGIHFDESENYVFQYISLDTISGVPWDATEHVDYDSTTSDPDTALGSIHKHGNYTTVTCYNAPEWFASTTSDFQVNDQGHKFFMGIAGTLYIQQPENAHLRAKFIPDIYDEINDKLRNPDGSLSYSVYESIQANWTGPTS